MHTRKLVDPKTDKTWVATISGKSLKIESGKIGKSKIIEKNFDSHSDALTQFEKEEWGLLKKGFILYNPDSVIGEPALHYFVGTGYSGCLPLVSRQDEIITNKNGDWSKKESDARSFCLNQNEDRFAVLKRQEVQIFDLKKRSSLHSFKIEHMVKTGQIAFIGDKLAIRTDYGCLSLYTV